MTSIKTRMYAGMILATLMIIPLYFSTTFELKTAGGTSIIWTVQLFIIAFMGGFVLYSFLALKERKRLRKEKEKKKK